MKRLIVMTLVLTTAFLLCIDGEAEPTVQAEPVGANPMDNPVVLNSPCYIAAANAKTLSLQIASLAGREVAEPNSTDVKKYLDTLRDRYLLVEGGLVDCLYREKAYSQSLMANQGMAAGTAETAAYKAAVESLQRTVADLPKSTPGETAFDRRLNTTLADFYGGWLKRFDGYENLKSVDGIHNRLRESLAQLSQTSVNCRAENRSNGSTDCSLLDTQISDANFMLDARVSDLAPRVAVLTKAVKDDEALKSSYMTQMQQIESQKMSTQYWIQYHMQMLQALNAGAQASMGNYQYYMYYASVWAYYSWYYGVYRNYGAANYFWWLACVYWNAAGSWLNAFYWYVNALNSYAASLATLMQQMKALVDAGPAVIAKIQATELDLNTQKALIIGSKVDRL